MYLYPTNYLYILLYCICSVPVSSVQRSCWKEAQAGLCELEACGDAWPADPDQLQEHWQAHEALRAPVRQERQEGEEVGP